MMNYKDLLDVIRNALLDSLGEYEFKENMVSVNEAIQCLRKSYYIRKLNIKPKYVEDHLNLIIGKAVHEFIQDRLERYSDSDIDFEFEVEVTDDILIGHIDAIMTYDGTDYVLEFKTVKNTPNKPLPTHFLQLNAYLNMYRSKRKANYGYVIYIPKHKGSIRAFSIKLNPDAYAHVKIRAERLYESLQNGRLPPADINNSCWFCEYYKYCSEATPRKFKKLNEVV